MSAQTFSVDRAVGPVASGERPRIDKATPSAETTKTVEIPRESPDPTDLNTSAFPRDVFKNPEWWK